MLASRRAVLAVTSAPALCRISAAQWARHSSTEATASADAPQPPAPSSAKAKSPPTVATSQPPNRSQNGFVAASKTTPRPGPKFAAPMSSAARSPASSTAGDSYSDPPLYDLAKVTNRVKLASAAEVKDAVTPDVDWRQSFRGVASRPVTEEQLRVLMSPVSEDDIEVKTDGIVYLPEIKYRRRLNEAFGPMGWGLIPKSEPVVGESIVTREYALIVDGRFVAQAQGENNYFGREQLPSAVEGCKSNALMRCCKDLGIASELWDPQYIRYFKKKHMQQQWVEHATTKKRRVLWFRKGLVDIPYPYKLAGAASASSS